MILYLLIISSSVLCGVVLGYAIADARSRKRELETERSSVDRYVDMTSYYQGQVNQLIQEHAAAVAEAHAAHAKTLENIINWNRTEKPSASVLDPGPTDSHALAELELREREVEVLTQKILDDADVEVSQGRARQEAERMLAYLGQ